MDTTQVVEWSIFIGLLYLALKENKRPSEMKALARKYGLSYSGPMPGAFFLKSSYECNILEGQVAGKKVRIFDHNGLPSRKYPGPFLTSGGPGSPSMTDRFTVISVDGQERRVDGFTGFASIKELDEALSDLQRSNS
jgi:hypothetical protein